ncbi:AP2-like ethylene-responsive transcription factor AIL5 [Wolffia australiana]
MAGEDTTGASVCNEADSFFWYNWQPFSNPQPEMFYPLPGDGPLNCRLGGGAAGGYNGWFLPFAAAGADSASPCSPHEDDPASSHNYLLHCPVDWHPFEAAAEPPQLEDFLSGRRATPPPSPPRAAVAPAQCFYSENQIAKKLSLEDVKLPPASVALMGTTGQRSSSYRGVTRHRWTGRYEAHLWDNTCVREGVKRKGRQVYLGGYDREEKAARAYDLAALKYWGPTAATNFPISNYAQEMDEMREVSRQEFVASLRRKSTGFSRGASVYRGVTRHHQHGRWQARIGRVAGNKDLYLGTFTTEEEAAEAYDIAAIKFRGVNAITNFELSRYNIEAIACTELPIGPSGKRLKLSPPAGEPDPSQEGPKPEPVGGAGFHLCWPAAMVSRDPTQVD